MLTRREQLLMRQMGIMGALSVEISICWSLWFSQPITFLFKHSWQRTSPFSTKIGLPQKCRRRFLLANVKFYINFNVTFKWIYVHKIVRNTLTILLCFVLHTKRFKAIHRDKLRIIWQLHDSWTWKQEINKLYLMWIALSLLVCFT